MDTCRGKHTHRLEWQRVVLSQVYGTLLSDTLWFCALLTYLVEDFGCLTTQTHREQASYLLLARQQASVLLVIRLYSFVKGQLMALCRKPGVSFYL